jgi:mono/diheme cytochrome c family protein
MKKWLPFAGLIILAIISTISMIISGDSDYIPQTADPAVIYEQACAECHGTGETPGNFWSPALSGEILTKKEVREIVRNGTWRMPAFPLVPDSLLDTLALYVSENRF